MSSGQAFTGRRGLMGILLRTRARRISYSASISATRAGCSFAISDRHRQTVETKALEVALMLEGQGLGTNVLLAILAKAGMKLASIDKEAANG
jgi:hypothetical protein